MTDTKKKSKNTHEFVEPSSFEAENHYYPRVLNASIHPLVAHFLSLGNTRIINRYCHLHPQVKPEDLQALLEYNSSYFAWAGADLFNVTTAEGIKKLVVIETNSCPSGQKSMPLVSESEEKNGYQTLISTTAQNKIRAVDKSLGELAVIYDKNFMEASGYATTLADEFEETVHLVSFYDKDPNPLVRFVDDGWMEVYAKDKWVRIRAAFRYVTQKPWNRIPIRTKTLILNPIIACLAGGRNKLLAAKAYEMYNAEIAHMNLTINTPETIRGLRKAEIPLWVEQFGGHAVVKVPYSNAGQGVFTITNEKELQEFMDSDFPYDQYIVQSLIGNYNWSSKTSQGQFYHVGTIANKRNQIYVADLRMMISCGTKGWKPLVIYARKAHKPLVSELKDAKFTSWEMLGTNLSVKQADNSWTTETNRLCLMDRRDFNQLGIGVDDLCEAYIQTVLSAIAIDQLATKLMPVDKAFNVDLFASMNHDDGLLSEINEASPSKKE